MNNSGNVPGPCPIAPRDEITPCGETPHSDEPVASHGDPVAVDRELRGNIYGIFQMFELLLVSVQKHFVLVRFLEDPFCTKCNK